MNGESPRVLIVTLTFAPGFGPNAAMAVRLSSALVERGAAVLVLALSEADELSIHPLDEGLVRALDPRVRVERVEAGPLRRRLRGARNPRELAARAKQGHLAQLLIPDPYMDCIPGLLRRGRALIPGWRPTLVLSLAYPWSGHVVGALLSRRARVPWIAVSADPWCNNPAADGLRPRWREAIDRRLEAWLLRRASTVVVSTRKTRELYARAYPAIADRLEVVRFGYPAAFAAAAPPRDRDRDGKIRVVHVGRIYRGARTPEPLLRALAALEPSTIAGRLRLQLVGELDDVSRAQIGELGLRDVVEVTDWVPRAEASRIVAGADILLLLGNHGGVQVPSKLYEYLGARRPILMLREDEEDESAAIIGGTGAGWVVSNDERSIAAFFQALLAGHVAEAAYSGPHAVEEYSEEASCARYWQLIQGLHSPAALPSGAGA